MTVNDIAAWSQIAASFAVLLTLVYLAIQVRQNTDMTRAEARQAAAGYVQQEIMINLDHPEVMVSLASEEPLTPEQSVRVTSWLNVTMRAREHEWMQRRSGVLDPESWEAYKQVIPTIMLGTPRARRWWAAFGKAQFHPEFCALVEALIAANPNPDIIKQFVEFG